MLGLPGAGPPTYPAREPEAKRCPGRPRKGRTQRGRSPALTASGVGGYPCPERTNWDREEFPFDLGRSFMGASADGVLQSAVGRGSVVYRPIPSDGPRCASSMNAVQPERPLSFPNLPQGFQFPLPIPRPVADLRRSLRAHHPDRLDRHRRLRAAARGRPCALGGRSLRIDSLA